MSGWIGPYEIRSELGRGAMAVVWRAWDPRLEREVAVKEPFTPTGVTEAMAAELADRFIQEGRAAAALNHPGIVTVFAADVYDGRPAIVMELLDGSTLSEVMDRGPLEPQAAIGIADQLLDAVGFAHARGIVHRDIKPDNVFVMPDGRVKLTDFGIAHVGAGARLTQAGTVMGTPGYMAPEQVTGAPVDARADLFAIGSMLHEMLTGRNPFGATDGIDTTTVMYRIVHEPAEPMPANVALLCSGALGRVLGIALAKDPAARFADAAAFRSALRGDMSVIADAAGRAAAVTAAVAAGYAPMTASMAAPAASSKGWLPYAIVGGIGAFVVIALLIGSAVPGGGSAGTVAASAGTGAASGSTSADAAEAAPTTESLMVTITGLSNGQRLAEGSRTSITVQTSNDARVAEVVIYEDGAAQTTGSVSPYTVTFVADHAGAIVISATVVDVDGNEFSSNPVTVDVEGAATSSPGDMVRAYYDACNSHDPNVAYGFFSSNYTSRVSFDTYAKNLGYWGNGTVTIDSVDDRGSSATVYATVVATRRSGGSPEHWIGTIGMVQQGGAWKIDTLNLTKG